MSQPLVAIVILNWNGQQLLEKFLPTVLRSTYPNKEVIVADNGSTDESVHFLTTHYPTVRNILIPQNKGYAAGYNEALQQVKADYYILLNSDVEVSPGWIEPLVTLLESHRTIAACQPKILSYNHKTQFEYAGACGGWIDFLGYPFARGRIFENCETDKGQYDQPTPIFWASGAALCIRANDFHACKGLDADFFAHQEEIDLCWRLQRSGKKIYACPQSTVWHVGGSTLPTGNSQKTFLNYRNNLSMLIKNLSLGKLAIILPIRFFLDALAAYQSLFRGDAGYWWAVARAHGTIVNKFFSLLAKRSKPEENARIDGVYPGSIVWQYFVKKRRTFQEIISPKS